MFWDHKVLQMLDVEEGIFSISCRFINVDDNFNWCFTSVYGPLNKRDMEGLWNELKLSEGFETNTNVWLGTLMSLDF